MDDLGMPSSYMALERGTPVYASDRKRLGRVERVIADFDDDIFEGIVIDKSPLPGEGYFAAAELVGDIHEHGVMLTLDAEAAAELPKPPG